MSDSGDSMKLYPGMGKSIRVRIKPGWHDAGRRGTTIGTVDTVYISASGQQWTPVQWNDEEDPDWCKTAALEVEPERKEDPCSDSKRPYRKL